MAGVSWSRVAALLLVSLGIHYLFVEDCVLHSGKSLQQFTDIDYSVFTSGQIAASSSPLDRGFESIPALPSFISSSSPYKRVTYRYSPVMGFLTIFNQITGIDSMAKYIFCILNLATTVLTKLILDRCEIEKSIELMLLAMSAFNPVVIQVAARGNSDALMTVLVCMALYLLKTKRNVLSAVVLGIAIHVKIYPILFLAPIILSLNPATNALLILRHVLQPVGEAWNKIFPNLTAPTHSSLKTKILTATKLIVYISLIPFMCAYELFIARMNRSQWIYAFVAVSAALSATAAVYHYYGWVALYEAFLYHFVRHDHRHNMSIFSIWATYLTPTRLLSGHQPKTAVLFKLLSTLSNKLLVILVGVGLAPISLYLALCLQILLFVTFNGVMTAQYFVWYASLFPLAIATLPGLKPIMTRGNYKDLFHALKPLLLGWIPFWLGSILLWVRFSGMFEHEGRVAGFYLMFVPDLLLLAAHIGIARFLLKRAHVA